MESYLSLGIGLLFFFNPVRLELEVVTKGESGSQRRQGVMGHTRVHTLYM